MLHGNGNNLLGLGDTENDGGQDTETVETLDLVANYGVNVDEVGATLLGKGDTVALARAEAKLAESVLSGGDGTELYSRSEVGLNDIEAVDLCVEQRDGILDVLQVQALKTGANALELG